MRIKRKKKVSKKKGRKKRSTRRGDVSVAGSDIEEEDSGGRFFNKRGFDKIPKKGQRDRLEFARSRTLFIFDGESVVVRFLEAEPTVCDTHSMRVDKRWKRVVCPEENPKYRGKCPHRNEKGEHDPAPTGMISLVDMRTLLSRESPKTGKTIYEWDLSDGTYEPHVDSKEYDRLGEEPNPKYKWRRFPPRVKMWWMSATTSRKLAQFDKKLRHRCVNCAKKGKADRIRVVGGKLKCSCGNPQPACITDCFVVITRTGTQTDTSYDFRVSEEFGYTRLPKPKEGKYEPINYEEEVPIPTPDDLKGATLFDDDDDDDE